MRGRKRLPIVPSAVGKTWYPTISSGNVDTGRYDELKQRFSPAHIYIEVIESCHISVNDRIITIFTIQHRVTCDVIHIDGELCAWIKDVYQRCWRPDNLHEVITVNLRNRGVWERKLRKEGSKNDLWHCRLILSRD